MSDGEKRILVPYDGSEQARHALDHVLEEFPAAEIWLLNVIDPIEAGYSAQATAFGGAEEWYETAREEAEELFEEARERAGERGAELETTTELGRPARAVIEFIDEHDVDHVVMGSHGRSGVSRILLGSVAESVVRRSPVPVTVVR